MMRSLFSGVSGLANQQTKMDVIGNNIANVSTVGFKASRINFAEELSQLVRPAGASATGGLQNGVFVGLGVRTGGVERNFSQGVLEATGKSTDLGLDGDGFFVVNDGARDMFTRAGNFHFDGNGRFVTSGGLFVRGWTADLRGDISDTTPVGNITLDSTVISPAIATENVSIAGNLDATAAPTREILTTVQVLTDSVSGNVAVGTSNLNDLTETTATLQDGDIINITGTEPDGSAVTSSFTFGAANDGTTVDDLLASINAAFTGSTATLDADGQIVLTDDAPDKSKSSITLSAASGNTGVISLPSFVMTSAGDIPTVSSSIQVFDSLGSSHTMDLTFSKTENPGEWTFQVSFPGDEIINAGSSGTLNFAADGTLETVTYTNGESTFEFDPANGAEVVRLNLDLENSTGFSGLTQFAGTSAVNLPFQDGQAKGSLNSFAIDEQGRLFGAFTNGKSRLIAQVALAKINNPEGLAHVGNNIYETSASTGIPIVGKAGTDFSTSVLSTTLEASNVDLGQEFAEMIIAQRAFQANARVITVSDQFLAEVTQLKR